MLVAAYFVLFAFVMLFAWAIETFYGQPRSVVRALRAERGRLAMVRAVHAQSFDVKSQHPQQAAFKLRTPEPESSSNPAIPALASRHSFLPERCPQRAATMQSLNHHRMSIVRDASRTAKPGPVPDFLAKGTPAKLVLVPRDQSIPV
jgi:hypothetical protein